MVFKLEDLAKAALAEDRQLRPNPRPDVEGIEARVNAGSPRTLLHSEVAALIAYVKALEAVMGALNRFDFQFFDNPPEVWERLSKALAALGDGDG